MILNAEIINQPYSGQFKEKIYDIQSPWNSQNWTWVKFQTDDYGEEWCGEFRGSPINVAISNKLSLILIITSDYLYSLDSKSAELIEYEYLPQYRNLTVSPLGYFLLADDYSIEVIDSSIKDKKTVELPLHTDMIKFGEWLDNILYITCDEFMNWDNHLKLAFDCDTLDVTIIKK